MRFPKISAKIEGNKVDRLVKIRKAFARDDEQEFSQLRQHGYPLYLRWIIVPRRRHTKEHEIVD